MVNVRRRFYAALLAALSVGLGACSTGYDYRNIQPTWAVRNSPIPVPYPKAKPATRVAKAPVVSRNVSWQPAAAVAAPTTVRVRAGDTVYGLARRYKVPPSQIISLNKLYKPYHLNNGMTLRLKAAKPRPKARVVQAVQRAPAPQQRSYKVKRGDTLYGIAGRENVFASSLIARNKLKRPYTLHVGQVLKLPSSSPQTRVVQAANVNRSPDAGSATFIWPVRGRVISGYGVKANGLRNDGVNISAVKGAAVYAAAAGEVIYAGSDLKAYGNLVLIRHKNGFISTYGHNSALLVVRGQAVSQGQQIARAGSSGNVAQPQLHFELRRNADAIDPMRYLGRTRLASNSR